MSDDLATLAQQIGRLQSAVVSGINEVALLRRQLLLLESDLAFMKQAAGSAAQDAKVVREQTERGFAFEATHGLVGTVRGTVKGR